MGLWRYEPTEPKLKAFVQEARWLSDAGWRMGKAILLQCASAISVGPFCRTRPYPEKVTSICTGYKVDSNESIKSPWFRGELGLARQLRYVRELPLWDGGQEFHDGDAKE